MFFTEILGTIVFHFKVKNSYVYFVSWSFLLKVLLILYWCQERVNCLNIWKDADESFALPRNSLYVYWKKDEIFLWLIDTYGRKAVGNQTKDLITKNERKALTFASTGKISNKENLLKRTRIQMCKEMIWNSINWSGNSQYTAKLNKSPSLSRQMTWLLKILANCPAVRPFF